MRKVKLSKVVSMYRELVGMDGGYFRDYFKERDLSFKLSRLELMLETLGDVELEDDYIKVFLYVGHQFGDKYYFQFTKEKILGCYKILKECKDMPLFVLDSLILYYDKECFDAFCLDVEFKKLIKKYGYTEELISAYSDLIHDSKKKLESFYAKEAKKMDYLKDEYSEKFVDRIKDAIRKKHVTYEYAMSLLPSKEFIDKSEVRVPIGYSILSGEDIVTRIIMEYVKLDEFEDEEKIALGPCSTGDYVYTSFTKKEYLEELKKQSKKVIKR